MTSTEQLIAALERMDSECPSARELGFEGYPEAVALRNALPALIELIRHLLEPELYEQDIDEHSARILEAMGEQDDG